MKVLGLTALAMASMLFTANASAQGEAPPAAAAAPDVVMLNDGGMVRGTISELAPGKQVVIVTVTGETRTYAMADVKYAGPAANAPGTAPPAPAPTPPPTPPVAAPAKEHSASGGMGTGAVRPFATVHGPEARLHFEGEPGVIIHRRSHSAAASGPGGEAYAVGFDEICSVPCDVSLPAGTYAFAASKGGRRPAPAEYRTAIPPGRSTVKGEYVDNKWIRIGGLVGGGAAIGVGAYLFFSAGEETQDCSRGSCIDTTEDDSTQQLIGGIVAGAGLLAAAVALSFGDKSKFTVVPGGPTAQYDTPPRDVGRLTLDQLQGLTAIGRF
ncbi:MAG: hypothetical protein R3B13_08235 [Polyangiaceae bacterium]